MKNSDLKTKLATLATLAKAELKVEEDKIVKLEVLVIQVISTVKTFC